jgi:hypothetical protein
MDTSKNNIATKDILALKLQIELAESNYKYAIELQKDSNLLLKLKEHIRYLKEQLSMLENNDGLMIHDIVG